MKDHYIYPALFSYYSDSIHITFPDLPGCVSFGETEERASINARDVFALHLCGMEEDGDSFPAPSKAYDIKPEAHQAVFLVDVSLNVMRSKLRKQSDKKTLTIPHWLNVEAERAGINFSRTLQKALLDELGLEDIA